MRWRELPWRHRLGSALFAAIVGAITALLAWQWLTDPAPRAQRAQEEAAVHAARAHLDAIVMSEGTLEIVDPLAPNRRAGKVYIYATADGWEISGYYRRPDGPAWHPWLMVLDSTLSLRALKVADTSLHAIAAADPRIELVTPGS